VGLGAGLDAVKKGACLYRESSIRRILEELAVTQLSKKFLTFYGIPRFLSHKNPVHPSVLFP
jgi:hypothetical protein